MKTFMRGCAEYDKAGKIVSGGTLVFHFLNGHAVGLNLYREWLDAGGPELQPGLELPRKS